MGSEQSAPVAPKKDRNAGNLARGGATNIIN